MHFLIFLALNLVAFAVSKSYYRPFLVVWKLCYVLIGLENLKSGNADNISPKCFQIVTYGTKFGLQWDICKTFSSSFIVLLPLEFSVVRNYVWKEKYNTCRPNLVEELNVRIQLKIFWNCIMDNFLYYTYGWLNLVCKILYHSHRCVNLTLRFVHHCGFNSILIREKYNIRTPQQIIFHTLHLNIEKRLK